MPRMVLKVVLPVAALSCIVIGSTIARSNHASIKGDQAVVTRNIVPQPVSITPDFDTAFVGRSSKGDRETPPRPAVKVDFDQVFSDAAAMSRRESTPANREKLRNAGWTGIARSQ
jgi:hypothetical protein